jgi:hypothetical protein
MLLPVKSNFFFFNEQHGFISHRQGASRLKRNVMYFCFMAGTTTLLWHSFSIRIQTAFWIVLFSFVLYLSTVAIGWPDALYRSLLILGCHIVNFYAGYSWIVPRYYEKQKYLQAFIGFILVLSVITPVRYGIERGFIVTESIPSGRLVNSSRIGFVLFSQIAITAFAALLRLAVSNEQSKRKIEAVEKNQLETELRFLKAQMSPHFLFNSINNIYSLTLIKSDKAPDALLKLSGLLRYILYECHNKVPLHREIKAMHDYIDLFQLKHESRLNLNISNVVSNMDYLIEPLILIPLLENMLKHSGLGLSPESYGSFEIKEHAGSLFIRTENSKAKVSLTIEKGGIGLQNIQKRMQMTGSQEQTLTITETENCFIVDLKIPIT